MVGAVLVYNGRIIGEGWHQEYGSAHAEVHCIESVAEQDRHLIPESTMYVSLEPCAHYGKTPPCAIRLIREQIKRVVVCNDDPFEAVKGKGYELLRNAGTEVLAGILKEQGKWLNRRFFCFHQLQRPYIILKWAQTSQGFFAPIDKSRKQLSNAASRQLVHQWRTQEAAILTGTTTAMNDDPQLTARYWKGKQPLRIVIDRTLKLPHSLKIFDDSTDTWILNETTERQNGNIHYHQIDFQASIIPQLLERLYSANIQSLIVEGGIYTLQQFIDAGLWDEARVFHTGEELKNGIAAPLLTDACHITRSEIDNDTLHVYTRIDTPFPYPGNMNL